MIDCATVRHSPQPIDQPGLPLNPVLIVPLAHHVDPHDVYAIASPSPLLRGSSGSACVLCFCVSLGLPLHIPWGIRPATGQRDDVIDYPALAGAALRTRGGRGFARLKRRDGLVIAGDAGVSPREHSAGSY